MTPVRVNERGQRIGESHHMARLSDKDVDQLLADRGPDDAPLMSYAQLAARYGISKSSVRDIVKGRRRGQIGLMVDGVPVKKVGAQKVRVNLVLSSPAVRAKLHRLGGGRWLEEMVVRADTHTAPHP